MATEKLPWVVIQVRPDPILLRTGGRVSEVKFLVEKETMGHRYLQDGEGVVRQDYNYSGWIHGARWRDAQIVGRFRYGKDAHKLAHKMKIVLKVMES